MKTDLGEEPKKKYFTLIVASAMLTIAMPTWSVAPVEETKLFAADGEAGDEFGYSVALSGDTAVITANADDSDVNGVDSGSVYIFTGLLDAGDANARSPSTSQLQFGQ